jgi:putative tricarboxylic transport membrane protein
VNGRRTDLVLAALILLLGVSIVAGATQIDPGIGYDRIGPRFFPYAVGAGLALLGIAVAASVRHARAPSDLSDRPLRLTWTPLLYLSLAFAATLAMFERAGFVIAASVQFWLVARAFDNRRPVRDMLVAMLLAGVVYLAFSRGLGLTLPAGLLGGG